MFTIWAKKQKAKQQNSKTNTTISDNIKGICI
jgi:hypothetical protein